MLKYNTYTREREREIGKLPPRPGSTLVDKKKNNLIFDVGVATEHAMRCYEWLLDGEQWVMSNKSAKAKFANHKSLGKDRCPLET